jgi:dihydrofolate reductase
VAKLVYITNMSVDGYIEDPTGAVDWTPFDAEVFAATTSLLGTFGTFLYGRKLYESMAHWETDPALAAQSDLTAEFATTWQRADKVVYSTTLDDVWTSSTSLERSFEPDAVRGLKASASSDLTIGGADLNARAMADGLVDECHLIVWPTILGGGKPGLPAGIRIDMELLDTQRFDNGTQRLHYRVVR